MQIPAPSDAPLIIQAPTQPLATAPTQPVMRAPQALQLPPEKKPAPIAESATPLGQVSAPPVSSAEKEQIIRGFANNVPLAVALRQLLPSEYGFSVGEGVQLSSLVSWQGGRPWRPILEDTLRSAGLAMREEGKMIRIVASPGKGETAKFLTPPSTASFEPKPTLQPLAETRPMTLLSPPPAQQIMQLPVSHVAASTFAQPMHVQPSSVVDTWTANRGETLHKVLDNWCQRANVELSWQAEYDYPLQATVTLTGTFEEVVRNLLAGFQEAQPQPTGTLHNSAVAGQTVLVIQARGNNYSD